MFGHRAVVDACGGVLPERPWGWLPEDAGRWAAPPDGAVAVEDLPAWNWPVEVCGEAWQDELLADEPVGAPPEELLADGSVDMSGWRLEEPGPDGPWPDGLCSDSRPPRPDGLDFDGLPPARAPWEALAGIEDVAPGPELALVLDLVDVTATDDRMLVETVAAWERVAAWAHLNAALAAGELSGRPAMNPNWNAPAPANAGVAGDELAMRLGWSKPAANRLVRDGRALGNELLATAEAVRDGGLDTFKLRTLTDRLADRPGQLAWMVQEQVLPGAATRTPGQLAADVDRALLVVDPVDAADRLARAAAKRRVCHPRRLPDGMAGIWAVLSAADAMRVDATLEATARAARALGDPHTLDQLRADILVDLATGQALQAGTAGTGSKASQSTAGTVLPKRLDVGLPAGHGGVVEAGGDGGRDDEPVGEPADEDELDESPDQPAGEDAQPLVGSTGGAGPPRPGGSPPGRVGVRMPKVRIDVTVALSTLLGLDEAPAELAGFGPISAEQARALAAGGVWRRLVTDPLSGQVLDVGRTRYRPPKALVEHVMARDRVCAGPGCAVRAGRCQIDHTVEYHAAPANGSPERGTTCVGNLGPLSDRCHRIKTDGGFTLTQVAPGVFEWHTPAGLAYRVVPGDHGRTERLHNGGAAHGRHTDPNPDHPDPAYPDEPPF